MNGTEESDGEDFLLKDDEDDTDLRCGLPALWLIMRLGHGAHKCLVLRWSICTSACCWLVSPASPVCLQRHAM